MHYNLPPWSISILPDCKHTVYNTARVRKVSSMLVFILEKYLECLQKALVVLNYYVINKNLINMSFLTKVGAQSGQMKMTPVGTEFSWQSYNEETAASYEDNSFTTVGLLEQINTTRDRTDYLWYTTE